MCRLVMRLSARTVLNPVMLFIKSRWLAVCYCYFFIADFGNGNVLDTFNKCLFNPNLLLCH